MKRQMVSLLQKWYNIFSIPFGTEWRIKTMLEFRYDTQLLIEGEDLDEDIIAEYFT